MAGCRFVEGRSNNFSLNGAHHVGNFFRTLINQQHHEVGVGMIARNGIGNVFHEHGLTGFGLCHNQGTLSFTNRGKEIDQTT